MRTFLLLLAIGATVAPVSAQELTVRGGVVALSTRRAYAFFEDVSTANATMNGLELSLRRGRLGLSARTTIARFLSDSVATAAGQVSFGEIRARYGPDILAGEIGMGRRGLSASLGRRDWSFVRVGARSAFPIGGTGLTAGAALGWYPRVSGTGDFIGGGGADAETRLSYDFPKWPAYVAIGYRIERFRADAPDDIRPEELSSLFIAAGFRIDTGLFDRTLRDGDRDGVPDRDDSCLTTPFGFRVDGNGCRSDADGDGVYDEADSCTNTPRGVPVNVRGCRPDTDADGVFDDEDACAGTPRGVRITVTGCRSDADQDGVYDEDDACEGTPLGTRVDVTGCRFDADGDRVADDIDACPNTEAGIAVDDRGCRLLFAEEAASLVLDGVTFESASAELTADAETILDLVAEALLGNPSVHVRVVGHTDASGSREQNVALSQSRAESVRSYLAERGVSIDRMEALGRGPDEPIDTNDTPEGRRTNRRVELERIG